MSYLYFIGIDISKDSFEVACYNQPDTPRTQQFSNNKSGFAQFIKTLEHPITHYFITLEATGGYEQNLLFYLCQNKLATHRLQTLKSSHYMRSLRVYGKNDVLDAEALARFGAERHATLPLFSMPSTAMIMLQKLQARRDDLIVINVAEKQRLKHPTYDDMAPSILRHCAFIKQELAEIEVKMAEIINQNHLLRQKKEIMMRFKGIGEQTSCVLLTICPELGTLTRRAIAALAGVAPHPRESGVYQGYRSTKGGRSQIKRALFMAALSAKTHDPKLKAFFNGLVARGKKKMVALTAIMRKIIVILDLFRN